MNQNYIDSFKQSFPKLSFQENSPLAPFTYMKVGGPASLFVEVQTKEDLFDLTSFCFTHAIPFIILGGASNVIIPDNGLDKLVIHNQTKDISIVSKTDKSSEITADSGVTTAVLAKKAADSGLTGFEYFVGVPGSVGGAIFNNSHFSAHQLFGECLVSVDVCTSEGKQETWRRDQLDLAYDHSIFHGQSDVILSATFLLEKDESAKIQERIIAAAQKRANTQPIGIPSSGCMFKNPVVTNTQLTMLANQTQIPDSAWREDNGVIQVAAGFLIDRAGLKGTTVGGAQVSDKHATYIINLGTASANDVDLLATQVEQKVRDKFGIQLEREVFFLS